MILIFSGVSAQDTIRLKEITIEAKKSLNWQRESIDSTKIELYFHDKIGEILKSEPAIIIKSQGSIGMQSISIRGTQNQHSQVLWNGMPIKSSLNGQFDYSQLMNDPNYYIGLYYGINSLQINNGALGGIICLETQPQKSLKNNTNLFLQWQSLKNEDISLSNTYTKSSFSTVNSIQFSKGKEQFDFKNTALLPIQTCTQNSPYQNLQFGNTNYFKLKDVHFIWANQFINSIKEISPLMTAYFKSEHNEEQTNQAFRSTIRANKKINNWNLEALAGLNYTTLGYLLTHSIGNSNITTINSHSEEQSQYYSLRWSNENIKIVQWSEHLQYSRDNGYYHDEKYNEGFCKIQQRITFTQDIQRQWTNNIRQKMVILLLYADKKISAMPALLSKINIGKNFSINHSVGFNKRLPTLNDLYYIPGGNPELKPEKALQNDLSFLFTPVKKQHPLNFSTTLFYSKIEDWILWTPTQFGYWEAQNVRNVDLYGIIFNINHQWIFNTAFNIQTNLNYTLQDIKGNDGKYKILHNPYIPNHITNLNLKITYKSIKYYIESQYLSKQFSMTYSDHYYLEPRIIVSSNISYTLTKKINTTCTWGVNNIFNTTYQSVIWRSMPGRYFNLSLIFSI